jgi:hypothetical protein
MTVGRKKMLGKQGQVSLAKLKLEADMCIQYRETDLTGCVLWDEKLAER